MIQVVRDALRWFSDGVDRRLRRMVWHIHYPSEVGPPEKRACLHCMEKWPCAELRRYEAERDAAKAPGRS